MKNVLGVIPARYRSSRFPGKPLVDLLGKPMVIHVAERAAVGLGGKENLVIATDDDRIGAVVKDWGYQVVMTADDHPTGTDRVWEVAQKIEARQYLNIQGDEPLINPDDIRKISIAKTENPGYVVNGYCRIDQDKEDPNSINIPKVIVNEQSELIYMSRLPIPGVKNPKTERQLDYFKQVCVYGFSYEELKAFGERKGKTYLESFEDIEILRFLEMGHKVLMVETSGASLAIDVLADVEPVLKVLRNEA